MSKKVNIGEEGVDGTPKTKNKGDSQQSKQKGAPSVSNRTAGKHLKDESGGLIRTLPKSSKTVFDNLEAVSKVR